MSLIDRIAALPARQPPLEQSPRFAAAVTDIRTRYADYRPMPSEALEVLVGQATTAVATGDWSQITEGDMATIAQAWAGREFVAPPDLNAFLKAEFNVTTRRNLARALCDGFLASWAPGDAWTASVAEIIQRRSAVLPRDWQTRFTTLPDLLDVVSGAEAFGRRLAPLKDAYRAAIEAGIVAPHGPGFMQHVHDAWLAAQPQPTDEEKAKRLLAWVLPTGARPLEGGRAASVVRLILQPWHKTMPPDALRAMLSKALTDAFGDPRRDTAGFWLAVGPEGRRVMIRWLAGRRMEVFLDVVSRAEAGGDHRGQWDPRRRFWMGIYESGRIDEGWVSFSKEAAEVATQLARETGDRGYLEFGRTAKSRGDTCLLIMKIGSKTIVEGSHNFRVHLFEPGRSRAPELYADDYDVDDFILPVGDQNTRMHDAAGNWMRWVMERI